MILEKEITIHLNSSFMLHHYKKLGYDIKFKDIITIPIEHLPKGSHMEITGICDVCGKEKKMMYKTYISSTGDSYCCRKCSKIKKNETMKEKYGFEHALQCEEFIEKKKDTWFEKYGVDHPMKNKDIKKKQEKTMKEKYGVEHALCNKEILDEMLNKQINDYGMYFFQTDDFKEKSKETCLEKYGVENVMSNSTIRNKFLKTMNDKYGVDYTLQNNDLLEKALKSGYKIKKYKNTSLYYQGSYEKDFLGLCEKIGILDKVERGFSIKYDFDGGKLIYFPDFFIKELNSIIEIKSDYWYKVHEEKNIVKEKTCKELGYEYLLVLNKNYSEFLKHSINII